MTDPIVEQARQAGQAYIDSFNGDRKAMLDDLRRRARQSGSQIVSHPPKPPRRTSTRSKKVG